MASNDITTYADVKALLDMAIANGGVIYRAKNPSGNFSTGAAIHMLQRINTFKRLHRQQDINSPYNGLFLHRRCNCRRNIGCPILNCEGYVIEIHPFRVMTVETFDGQKHTVQSEPIQIEIHEEVAEYTSDAEALRKKIMGGLE